MADELKKAADVRLNDIGASNPFGSGGPAGPQLDEQAKAQFENVSRAFNPFVAVVKEEAKPSQEEEERKERAKRANKIYRQVCSEAGLNSCFFNNFVNWSDYVGGKISEAEFREMALSQARKMADDSEN